MLFKNVAIAGLAHIDAPRRLSSDEINARLKPTLDRLGIKTDVLQDVAGIHARRLWDDEVQASDAATMAEYARPTLDRVAPPYRTKESIVSATSHALARATGSVRWEQPAATIGECMHSRKSNIAFDPDARTTSSPPSTNSFLYLY